MTTTDTPQTPQREEVLQRAESFAREVLAGDSSGHDWLHIQRVTTLAGVIAQAEGADSYVCALAALLHDIADDKIAGDAASGLQRVRSWLEAQALAAPLVEQVMEIIATMSFGGGSSHPMTTLEGCVVQDADRLDAIGAIGIARAFAFGGTRGRALFDPTETPKQYASKAAYRASSSSTVMHFHEKLLLLKDRMTTAYARQLAEDRHRYMEAFLDEFAREWSGER